MSCIGSSQTQEITAGGMIKESFMEKALELDFEEWVDFLQVMIRGKFGRTCLAKNMDVIPRFEQCQ